MNTPKVIPYRKVAYLNNLLLDSTGKLKVVAAEDLKTVPVEDLQVWGNLRGVYCFPTWELITWLRSVIGNRSAIEICSGNGAIGRALDIPRTDSFMQTMPQIMAAYEAMGQKPIRPPEDVKPFEALEAVKTYKPQVVLGSYITQKYLPGDERPPKIGSSIYGVDELLLLTKVETYICIGNEMTHGDKRILNKPHRVLKPDWLFTRSVEPNKNIIYIWG